MENFTQRVDELFHAVYALNSASASLPQDDDLSFYKAFSAPFANDLSNASQHLLHMANQLLLHVSTTTQMEFIDAQDVTERYSDVVDVMDHLFEMVDVSLAPVVGAVSQSQPTLVQVTSQKTGYQLFHASNIVRPQLSFPDTIDNSNTPFRRKITRKPHAIKPLEYGMVREETDSGASEHGDALESHLRTLGIADGMITAPHAYAYEIDQYTYPERVFQQREPIPWVGMDKMELIFVDTPQVFQAMLEDLTVQQEIAIDLEAHQMRSFQGFTCLIQISTRRQDYIVDALQLRGELQELNVVTANPDIVKVLHGADSDIVWLQRDFGVYIVGLFDTFHASKVLGSPLCVI